MLTTIEWLINNCGPTIHYRILRELLGSNDVGQSQLRLILQREKIKWLLQQLDNFDPITKVNIHVLNTIHGMKPTCLENIVPRLVESGLHAGVGVFDKKMERFRQYIDNPVVNRALDNPSMPSIEGGRAIFIATIMASLFIRAGYNYEEINRFILHRLGLLSKLAMEGDYSIHIPVSRLIGLPNRWKGKPILKNEVIPTEGTKPLPLIHDLFAFAYLDMGKLKKVEYQQLKSIIHYVLDQRYKNFPVGYGYIWPLENRRICYACGWNIDIPEVKKSDIYQQHKIIQRLELLAHLPLAQHSTWFQKGMKLLETYKTHKGTYQLPTTYLVENKSGYYVGGDYMGLEDGRRNPRVMELESTFRVQLLKNILLQHK
jgi:hypothetical protein